MGLIVIVEIVLGGTLLAGSGAAVSNFVRGRRERRRDAWRREKAAEHQARWAAAVEKVTPLEAPVLAIPANDVVESAPLPRTIPQGAPGTRVTDPPAVMPSRVFWSINGYHAMPSGWQTLEVGLWRPSGADRQRHYPFDRSDRRRRSIHPF